MVAMIMMEDTGKRWFTSRVEEVGGILIAVFASDSKENTIFNDASDVGLDAVF